MSSLRVDELIVPITGVRLVRGGLEITAHIAGPCEAASGYIRIFDDQGEPVTDLSEGSPTYLTLPSVRAGDTMNFTYMLWFAHIRPDRDPVVNVRCA